MSLIFYPTPQRYSIVTGLKASELTCYNDHPITCVMVKISRRLSTNLANGFYELVSYHTNPDSMIPKVRITSKSMPMLNSLPVVI